MNKIVDNLRRESIEPTLKEVCDKYEGKETAFVGECGAGSYGLYFISFESIISAKDPTDSWSAENCPVTIDRFVSVEIKIVEQEDGE